MERSVGSGTDPKSAHTYDSSRYQRSKSRDELQTARLNAWINDEEATPSLLGRLWQDQSTIQAKLEQRQKRMSQQLSSLGYAISNASSSQHSIASSSSEGISDPSREHDPSATQCGDGGVETSRPYSPADVIDPPRFDRGQSGATITTNPHWPSCPRCGANVHNPRNLPWSGIKIIHCLRVTEI